MRKRMLDEAVDRLNNGSCLPTAEWWAVHDKAWELARKADETRFRWKARKGERKARTPAGHDQPDWV